MKNKSGYKVMFLLILVLLLGFIIVLYYFKDEKIYTLSEYSPTGRLLGTNEYVIRKGDTIMHGKFVNFNHDGIKISEGQFVNDEPYGVCNYYYDNGKLEAVEYKKDSKTTLEATYYSPKGFIDKYIVYDDVGTPSFMIDFDEKGVSKYEGYAIIETSLYGFSKDVINVKQKNLKIRDTLKYSYIIANIPNTNRSFKIENISVDNSKVKRTLKHIPPAEVDVEEILTKKGKNTIRSIVRYEFKDNITPVYTDTLTFDINVN